jgi:hypothetical protein
LPLQRTAGLSNYTVENLELKGRLEQTDLLNFIKDSGLDRVFLNSVLFSKAIDWNFVLLSTAPSSTCL